MVNPASRITAHAGVLAAAISLLMAPAAVAQTQPDPQTVEAAVERAVGFLSQQQRHGDSGYETLAALALQKSGEPHDHPVIARTLERIASRTNQETYAAGPHHYYEAALELVLLGAVDPERYRTQMEVVTQYILAGQKPGGHWYYPNQTDNGGDTSITQYALLGLWAAANAGLDVPLSAWDKAARWHLATQRPDGGWTYHPGDGGQSRHAMTAAGLGSLYLIRLQLYPHRESIRRRTGPVPAGKKFGVLEPVDPSAATPARPKAARDRAAIETSIRDIDAALARGTQWLDRGFTVEPIGGNGAYYLYALERVGAFGDLKHIGTHDWYAHGANVFLRRQQPGGAFTSDRGTSAGTSFGLLFLTRATARQLKRPPPVTVGAGLLAGGRGLPENLDAVEMAGGQVEAAKLAGPLDALLSELENPRSAQVESAQRALLEKVQLGDREALIDQVDRLKKLAGDPRVEVRRTALWALGRSRDLRVAPLLIEALADQNLDVAVEAYNGLCYLSRRPRGIGLPPSPLQDVAEDATETARATAIDRWRTEAKTRWQNWYLTARPYEERDDLRPPPRR